mmetsp:Transcript_9899/g.40247  ORF Transcript_9899/g.40247 Transcript_9899/m.40247 type:complete len:465 (-) Transcript_9899:274-1668(-)|eukprot:CAMPEP_0185718020 /NCGR_PEP_ID=MMETSP1164-20130828/45920_1 /TAXON_ID=1104430 /ORGANISM="Chrysoreinhardia sp, Strain CCMP2950" /LENGTH=464 /DNA_ID=CAMNT_0028385661 /DNA_START=9 /DNA_END=1403 /DNA_ORIENTATION=+
MATSLAFGALVAALVASAHAAHHPVNSCAKETAVPIILDIDPNIDDILALAYLAKQGDVELKAVIVTSTGFSNPSAGVNIVYRELEMLGLGDVDVGVGPFYPTGCNIFNSADPDAFCDQMRVVNRVDHWRIDNMYGTLNRRLPYSKRYATFEDMDGTQTDPPDSAEIYAKWVGMGVTTVVTCGPLTSLLDFKTQDPEAFATITTLYAMLGNVDVLGNVYTLPGNDVAEFNVMADTVAAREIVNSSIAEIRLVTLDGTNFVSVTREFFEAMSLIDTPEGEFVFDVTKQARDNWFSGVDGFFGELEDGSVTNQSIADGYFLWDPLAAVLAVFPALAEWSMESLIVTTSTPVDLDHDGAFVRDETMGNDVYFTTSVTPENADAVRAEIAAVLEKECITDQPVTLERLVEVYELLAYEHGDVVDAEWVPNACSETVPCPEGYECKDTSAMRRKLRFGYAEAMMECVAM